MSIGSKDNVRKRSYADADADADVIRTKNNMSPPPSAGGDIILLERKKNGQIKGLISNVWLILCYTVPSFVPNLKILGQVVPEKSLTENFV